MYSPRVYGNLVVSIQYEGQKALDMADENNARAYATLQLDCTRIRIPHPPKSSVSSSFTSRSGDTPTTVVTFFWETFEGSVRASRLYAEIKIQYLISPSMPTKTWEDI